MFYKVLRFIGAIIVALLFGYLVVFFHIAFFGGVKGSKVIAALPLIFFVLGVIEDFRILFIDPVEFIIDDIGQGFWYYFGAILTFIDIVICYGVFAISLFVTEEN